MTNHPNLPNPQYKLFDKVTNFINTPNVFWSVFFLIFSIGLIKLTITIPQLILQRYDT